MTNEPDRSAMSTCEASSLSLSVDPSDSGVMPVDAGFVDATTSLSAPMTNDDPTGDQIVVVESRLPIRRRNSVAKSSVCGDCDTGTDHRVCAIANPRQRESFKFRWISLQHRP